MKRGLLIMPSLSSLRKMFWGVGFVCRHKQAQMRVCMKGIYFDIYVGAVGIYAIQSAHVARQIWK